MVICYNLNSINVIMNCDLSICWWKYIESNVHLHEWYYFAPTRIDNDDQNLHHQNS
jgi:hypothetical protein